ncbi:MAG: BamA/TamA family outer membrane protein, partial [Sediminibacterium sp.]|nr:BamA/TamA family outer membrane protein [Sediminibacterium sp.]
MRLTVNKDLLHFFYLSLFMAMTSSCSVLKSTSVKDYPLNRPFVYENKIVLNGDISKDEKTRLAEDLVNYWDDSLQVRKLQKFGFIYSIKNPPVFDTNNVTRTINFMNAYLNSQGYYYAVFNDSIRIDTMNDQLRTTVTMNIDLGKNITIDSISFNLGDSTLQRLTRESGKNSFLKKGQPYTNQAINAEVDRLVGLYREYGFFNFTREDIYTVIDTTDAILLTLRLDRFR